MRADLQRVVSRFIQLLNSGDAGLAADVISPSALFHLPGESEALMGPRGCLEIVRLVRQGFPDMRWTLRDVIGEADRAAARLSLRGTHLGSFLGAAATGRAVLLDSVGFYRIAGGKVLEEHVQPGLTGLLHCVTPRSRPWHRSVRLRPSRRSSVAFLSSSSFGGRWM